MQFSVPGAFGSKIPFNSLLVTTTSERAHIRKCVCFKVGGVASTNHTFVIRLNGSKSSAPATAPWFSCGVHTRKPTSKLASRTWQMVIYDLIN